MTDKTLEEQTKKREGRAKPLTTKQIDLLNDIYYTKHLTFGRDKLFKYLQLNHPEEKISRRAIATWLLKQENHQIHRRAKTQKDVRATVSRKPYQVIQIDLGNLQNFEINGFQYFMVGVDMFTRMVFLRAMKDRTEGEINRAFQSIHKEVKTEMKTLRADNEFTSSSFKKYLKDNNIRAVYGTPSTPHSQGQAEKFVGLTKRVISSATLNDETFNWVKNMNKIAEAFNDTISKSTGYSPNQIEKFYNDGDTEKISEIYQEQVNIKSKTNKLAKQEFFEGDKVRIFTAQENDLYPQRKWSLDLYTIEKVFKPKKEYSNYTYKLEGEKEVYQNHELLKVLGEEKKVSVPERWEVSKIIRPTISKNVPSYIIKWKNYKDEYIEPRTNLDVAGYKKELAKFEKKYKQDNNIDEIFVKYTSGKNKGKWRLKK